MKTLRVRNHELQLPVFLPDATYGYLRAVSMADLANLGLPATMMNAFHLMQKPGSTVIDALGGVHAMSGWEGLVMTDSGGFQAYSLIRQNPRFGSLTENGIIFRPEGSQRKLQLTPEKSIQLQMGYGADILVCLDDCTHESAPYSEQELSVERTIAWAGRARQAYERLLHSRKWGDADRPLLFAVVQGGSEKDLRKACAEALLELGFDGFGFGGWPLDSEGQLLTEILEYTRSLIPRGFPIHALGIGHPVSIMTAFRLGYEMFDSAMPTRDARHGRLYAINAETLPLSTDGSWFSYKYINNETNTRAAAPISPGCTCPTCTELSLGYLYHLYRMNDAGYLRLATLHNLAIMRRLMELLQQYG